MTTNKKTGSISAREALEPTIAHTSFGELVRSIRTCDEISQAELARRLGVSRQFLNAIELGKSQVGLDFAKRVADALGYSPEPFAEILIRNQLHEAGIECNIRLVPGSAA
jgi:transcriptional regulator with XRE-family HTH domain